MTQYHYFNGVVGQLVGENFIDGFKQRRKREVSVFRGH